MSQTASASSVTAAVTGVVPIGVATPVLCDPADNGSIGRGRVGNDDAAGGGVAAGLVTVIRYSIFSPELGGFCCVIIVCRINVSDAVEVSTAARTRDFLMMVSS